MVDAGLRCVLCLDEFEALLDTPKEFDDRFYDALRAAMDDQTLMLVIGSARPLSYYGSRFRFVSRFFNLGNTLRLEELTEEEAARSCVFRSIPPGRSRRWGWRPSAGPQAWGAPPLPLANGGLLRLRGAGDRAG